MPIFLGKKSMTLFRAMQLPPCRQMVSGFAVAVFALVLLSSITQAHAQPSAAGKVVVNHLDHLVVASHNPALAVAQTGPVEDEPFIDSPEHLAQLLGALLWSQSRSPEIGRASCRERVEVLVGAATL